MARRAFLARLDDADDVARLRAMDDDERAATLVGLMRAAARLLAAHEQRERILTVREALSPSAEATLAELRRRHRARAP